MSASVRVAVDGEWNRNDRQYERKYGVGFGIMFKDLRSVQTIAFDDANFKSQPLHRMMSLPSSTCTPNAVPLVETTTRRSVRGKTGDDSKNYYEVKTISSEPEPLWVSLVRPPKKTYPPNDTLEESDAVAPYLFFEYVDRTTRLVQMHDFIEGVDDMDELLDLSTIRPNESIVDTRVKFVYVDPQSGRRYVLENKKPFSHETIFRVRREDGAIHDRCYANKIVAHDRNRCPVATPFMPTCRVPIISLLREGLVFDVKCADNRLYVVRAHYVNNDWVLLKLDERLIDAVNADLNRPRAFRVFQLKEGENEPVDFEATPGKNTFTTKHEHPFKINDRVWVTGTEVLPPGRPYTVTKSSANEIELVNLRYPDEDLDNISVSRDDTMRPINVVAVRGPRITHLETAFAQKHARCDTTKWKTNLEARAKHTKRQRFFTTAHVGMHVTFEFDYTAHKCHATLTRDSTIKRVDVTFEKDQEPEDGFGGRVAKVTRDSIFVVNALDGNVHEIRNPARAISNDAFVFTMDELHQGVPYRDLILRTTRVSGVPSAQDCCEVVSLVRQNPIVGLKWRIAKKGETAGFTKLANDDKHSAFQAWIECFVPELVDALARNTEFTRERWSLFNVTVGRRTFVTVGSYTMVPDDEDAIVMPREHACSSAPFYLKMRRTSDSTDRFDYFCNTKLHDDEAVDAHLRGHDTPIDVTNYRMPSLEKKEFFGDDLAWKHRDADGWKTDDVSRPRSTNARQFEFEDTVFTDYGHRHEDDALITLQHHLDFKYGPNRLLVMSNPKLSLYGEDRKATPDGVVMNMPLLVVEAPSGSFFMHFTQPYDSEWRQYFEKDTATSSDNASMPHLSEITSGTRTDSRACMEVSAPTQLIPGHTVLEFNGEFLRYEPKRKTLICANVEAKSHMKKLPMGEIMLASVANQVRSQFKLMNKWSRYVDATFVVSWTPRCSTVYEIGKDTVDAIGSAVRGEMVRSAVQSNPRTADLSPPLHASVSINTDILRCASVQDSKDAAVSMRVLSAMLGIAYGQIADDGGILRGIECSSTRGCAYVYDDGRPRMAPKVLNTPMCTHCLQDKMSSPTVRFYLMDATNEFDSLAFVLVHQLDARLWNIYDTLPEALERLGIATQERLYKTPAAEPVLQPLGVTTTVPQEMRLYGDDGICTLHIANISSHVAKEHTDAHVFYVNVERDIQRLMTRLTALHIHQRTNKRAYLNWWCDLFLLIALRPGDKTYHISIDPTLTSHEFENAAVDAMVMYVDMIRDAAEATHFTCSPQGRLWRRMQRDERGVPSPHAKILRPLLQAAWDNKDANTAFLSIDPPMLRFNRMNFVEVTNPHTLTKTLFVSDCDETIYSSDHQFLRTIFKNKTRPVFKNVQMEKRIQEKITRI
jgi:hypothetical protein